MRHRHLSHKRRQFSLGLVRQVVDQDEDGLLRTLSALQTKDFIYELPSLTDVDYVFKHALTQEVAYGIVAEQT